MNSFKVILLYILLSINLISQDCSHILSHSHGSFLFWMWCTALPNKLDSIHKYNIIKQSLFSEKINLSPDICAEKCLCLIGSVYRKPFPTHIQYFGVELSEWPQDISLSWSNTAGDTYLSSTLHTLVSISIPILLGMVLMVLSDMAYRWSIVNIPIWMVKKAQPWGPFGNCQL